MYRERKILALLLIAIFTLFHATRVVAVLWSKDIIITNMATLTPSVTLTAPSNGASYTVGQSITITANSINCHHLAVFINDVYYGDSYLLCPDNGNTLSYTFTPPEVGSYRICVKGRNTAGESDPGTVLATSSTATVTILGGDDFSLLTRTLISGCKGADVADLQRALIWLGYLNDRADGVFGGNTQSAVNAVKAALGLSQNGTVTPADWNFITNKWYNEKAGILAYCPSGTPEEYKPYIGALMKKYSNWSFEFFNTDLSWNPFIDAEFDTTKHRSLTQRTTWINDYNTTGIANWYHAKRDVVDHIADPRDFLNLMHTFQFEKLAYDSSIHTQSGVSSILSSSFMGNSTYANYFMQAASESQVSPYHLASKSRHEMSDSGNPLSDGYSIDGILYYNYYNIGAWGSTTAQTLQRGAEFAKSQSPPWISKQIAIVEGAKWIARNYISVGQNTMYLQKFDLVGTLYTNQYAQNIEAACGEGKGYYDGYNATGSLDTNFVFRIPIFTDLPAIRSKPTVLP